MKPTVDTSTIRAMRDYAKGRQWIVDHEGFKVDGVLVSESEFKPSYLKAYAQRMRDQYIEKGTTATVGSRSIPIWTDSKGRVAVMEVLAATQVNPDFSTNWKASNGDFYSLNAAEITQLAKGMFDHIKNAFAKEAKIVFQINSGVVQTTEVIDSMFAA